MRNGPTSESIGMLRGNKFTIVIRNMEGNEEDIRKKIDEFALQLGQGVPNYFGEQRFGGYREITHVVGKLLLQNRTEEAIMEYLCKESEGELDSLRDARKRLRETRDFAAALKEFPDSAHFEIAMLNHLVNLPTDFAGAFQRLPAQTWYLFTRVPEPRVQFDCRRTCETEAVLPMEGDVLERNSNRRVTGIRSNLRRNSGRQVTNHDGGLPLRFAN